MKKIIFHPLLLCIGIFTTLSCCLNITMMPDQMNAELLFNLGEGLYALKKYPEALEMYKKTISLKSDHYQAYAQLGRLMNDLDRPYTAITLLKKSLSLQPNDPKTRLALAQTYKNQKHFDEAIETLIEGLARKPYHIMLTVELATVYSLLNQLDKSLTVYQEFDQQIPNNPTILYNSAFVLKQMEKLDEAILFLNKVLETGQYHDEALFERGLIYLAMGDFKQGWQGYEWRYNRFLPGSIRTYTQPRWDGSDLHGKTILIHAEQGFGDTFQFIRYAKLIKEKNGIVIAVVQDPLVTLIQRCPYIDQVVSIDETPPYCDVQAPIMALPYILQTRIDTIPNECPYLTADEKLVDYWKKQLSADKNFKIGICWQPKNKHATPALQETVTRKSVHVRQFEPLSAIPGVTLYSLQKTTGTDQLENLPSSMQVISFDNDFDQSNGRFMDSAALIKNLDLIITVDTSVCHLAAGLGVPTWVLLPKLADWRWMMNRTDSPWYPTMRLFRQPTAGDWESVIKEVVEELKKYSEKKAAL